MRRSVAAWLVVVCPECRAASVSRSGALCGPVPVICCKWGPSAWPASPGPGTRSPATAQRQALRSARVGYNFCHSLIDDHTRIADTEIHRDEKAPTVTAFVERALAFYAGLGITPQRLTDRQRLVLRPQHQPARAADRPGDPAPADPTADPEAQRKGGALPTDPRSRTGLRTALPELHGSCPRATDLAQPLQPQPEPQLALKPTTDQPTRSEPPEAQHLAGDALALAR
jgi:hypothetical protein